MDVVFFAELEFRLVIMSSYVLHYFLLYEINSLEFMNILKVWKVFCLNMLT